VQRWLERAREASARVVDCAEQAGAALIFEGGCAALIFEGGCAVSDRDIEVELLPEQIAAVRGLVEACDDLRELAQESDAVVEEDAAAAETAAREALEAVLAGDADAATSCAEEAAHRERRYGDAPTWGALRDAVQRWWLAGR
jgi:hypothetical protein